MKVTYHWLKQYVDFEWPPEELAARLTMLGLEVESIQKLGGEFDGIVVAQVLTSEQHPNADKLTVCRVNDGQSERPIVCGAHNFKPGDKVPLILPGASLPARSGEPPFTIKVGKIRGVESHGMMCSPKELGLAEDAEGLMILPADAKVGQPFAEFLGRTGSDVVFDLEITPNRPDWNSVIGIAREIAAVTGNPLRRPDPSEGAATRRPERSEDSATRTARPSEKAQDLVAVRLDDPDLCPRYTARLIRGVKIGPSPDWLRSMLEKVGLRSISNVVDVTNYVMMECGQPLHAFDYHLIARGAGGKPTIVVRRASSGEKFKTLDGQEHTLSSENLLIADEQRGIALAGVMGGENTEINERTVDVLLESAYFSPTNIRRTSKATGLRTDASYRFERGADLGNTDWASQRAAQLILETAGGQLADGVVDAYPNPVQARQVTLRHHKANELLGLDLKPEEMEYFLGQLELKIVGRKPRPVGTDSRQPEPVTFRIPTFRVDLKREIDLIEEIARLYGVDKIPATPPRGAVGENAYDSVYDQIGEARRLLSGLGLNEAQGQTLIPSAEPGLRAADSLCLANPLSAEMDLLRPSLLPGLLHALRHNLSHKNASVALFEVGRVFSRTNGQTREERRLALALTGPRNGVFWCGEERDARYDAFDLKGILEEFLEQFGVRGLAYQKRADSTPVFLESATVSIGGKVPLGEFGLLLPALAKKYDLRDPVVLAELNLDTLVAKRNPSNVFKPLPAYPSIRRDVAMILPESTTHEAVVQTVRAARPANLEAVELFDVFRGKNMPSGQKSVAYAFTYRHADRTLTDAEVNTAHDNLVAQLKQKLGAVVRE